MTTPRFLFIVSALLVPAAAIALPAMVKTFQTQYSPAKGSALAKAGCAVCHVGATAKLNSYGTDLKAAMAAQKSKALTPSALKAVEAKDSDKDGVTNIDEIKAGKLPGDAKSK